jgi:hypothetical protein
MLGRQGARQQQDEAACKTHRAEQGRADFQDDVAHRGDEAAAGARSDRLDRSVEHERERKRMR